MLKKYSSLFFLFVSFSIAVHSQNWERYTNKELSFIVDFPGKPKKVEQNVPTAFGDLLMTMFNVSDSSTKNFQYGIAHTEYPKSYIKSDDKFVDNLLESAVSGAVSNVNGELIFKRNIVLNGYKGKYIKVKIPVIGFLYMKAMLVEQMMYIVQVGCTYPNEDNKDIDKFVNSFNLIKTK